MAKTMARNGCKTAVSHFFLRHLPVQVSLVKSLKTMDKHQLSTALLCTSGFDTFSIESVQLSESVLTFSKTLLISALLEHIFFCLVTYMEENSTLGVWLKVANFKTSSHSLF